MRNTPTLKSRRNVLVFPAGTEIGLEVFHALEHCKEVQLHGAGQDVSNHARFLYPSYHVLPSIHEADWLNELVELCQRLKIDYIFPAYDDVIVALAREQASLPAHVVTSPLRTCEVSRSKRLTYELLASHVRVPALYATAAQVPAYPVLIKPDRGQGSAGIRKVHNPEELALATAAVIDPLICEYLPGEEFTVDCFSDRERGVLFAKARRRQRTRNGIAVNTVTCDVAGVTEIAASIQAVLPLHGAWFFQVKRAEDGTLSLLEVAPRIAGSMATHRMLGINFPLLSMFEHERMPVRLLENKTSIELDRALSNRYKHDIEFSRLYIDLDDTLIVHGQVNLLAISLVFRCINGGRAVVLVTRHASDLEATLRKHRLLGLFDDVIHLRAGERKSQHIDPAGAVFVDDSFTERLDVHEMHGIPTFDTSMIELLAS